MIVIYAMKFCLTFVPHLLNPTNHAFNNFLMYGGF